MRFLLGAFGIIGGVLTTGALACEVQFEALPKGYDSWFGIQKQKYLMSRVRETAYDEESLPKRLTGKDFDRRWRAFRSLEVSFDRNSDLLPAFRPKIFHPFGSVATVEYVPIPRIEANPGKYTGIFRSGAYGLARLSLAGVGFLPGMALKFFIEGQPSVNVHTLSSLKSDGKNRDFFAYALSNVLDPPNASQVFRTLLFEMGKVLLGRTHPADRLPVSQLGVYDRRGEQERDPYAPTQLVFEPSEEAKASFIFSKDQDFRLSLESLPVGIAIYDVYDLEEGERVHIGRIRLTSKPIASRFGDEALFFRHHRLSTSVTP